MLAYLVRALRHFAVGNLVLKYDDCSTKERVKTTRQSADVAQEVHDAVNFSLDHSQVLAELKGHGTLHVVLPIVETRRSFQDVENILR